jgi:hypothetical protein
LIVHLLLLLCLHFDGILTVAIIAVVSHPGVSVVPAIAGALTLLTSLLLLAFLFLLALLLLLATLLYYVPCLQCCLSCCH